MSHTLKDDEIQTGWKIWYYIDGQPQSFESSSTNWVDLPDEGVQTLIRYFSKKDGSNSWNEWIGGLDLYTETNKDLRTLVPQSYVKIGVGDNFAKYAPKLQETRDSLTKYSVDNSIEKYSDDLKTVVGWKAVRMPSQGVFETYTSKDNVWEDLPKDKYVGLIRYMKSGSQFWGEDIFKHDLYVLDTVQEKSLVVDNKAIKRGTLMDETILKELQSTIRSELPQ